MDPTKSVGSITKVGEAHRLLTFGDKTRRVLHQTIRTHVTRALLLSCALLAAVACSSSAGPSTTATTGGSVATTELAATTEPATTEPATTTTASSTTAPPTAATEESATAPPTIETVTTEPTTAPPAPFDPTAIAVREAVAPGAIAIGGTLLTADGRDRTFTVYVPSTVSAQPVSTAVPLLIALHGGTGWGKQFELNSGFDGVAEANGFIVVYPDGIGVGPDGTQLRTWNGGACCGPAVTQQVDDVAFIRLLIAQLESQYDIDPARVFATGHSNGGILAYRLACELSDQIVAIGVQSTALEVTDCRPARAVSVLQIHGSGDQNIPIGGGLGPNAISGVAFNPPIDGATTLAAADGCPATPSRTTSPSNADLDITSWSPCAAGTEVAFVEVAGATHAWMGHTTGGSGKVGPPYAKLDSSLVIWSFLSQHARS
jgi:polyhydroxybutyrate depolymerase